MRSTTHADDAWLALDVGGANIKAAHDCGSATYHPFPLWKRPGDLPAVLARVIRTFPPFARVALTMTAELCDCYATKAEGVLDVLDATLWATGGRPISIWGIDGRFHDPGWIRQRPGVAAASNWLALAHVAARLTQPGRGILIDVGSTTSDLIPFFDGLARPEGLSDAERLQTGELVYAGVRRTPVCALVDQLPHRGRPTRVAAELFATTLDVYLTLGAIPPDPTDLDTADGRPATIDAARSRLARMVGADADSFTEEDALEASAAVDLALIERLHGAAQQALSSRTRRPNSAVLSGSGEFLARRLTTRLLPEGTPVISLRDAWGPEGSSAACARALLILARDPLP
jgi:probable H4MPT-linked C1 transfer pathway protein